MSYEYDEIPEILIKKHIKKNQRHSHTQRE